MQGARRSPRSKGRELCPVDCGTAGSRCLWRRRACCPCCSRSRRCCCAGCTARSCQPAAATQQWRLCACPNPGRQPPRRLPSRRPSIWEQWQRWLSCFICPAEGPGQCRHWLGAQSAGCWASRLGRCSREPESIHVGCGLEGRIKGANMLGTCELLSALHCRVKCDRKCDCKCDFVDGKWREGQGRAHANACDACLRSCICLILCSHGVNPHLCSSLALHRLLAAA